MSQILQTYCHHRFTRLIVNTLKTKLWHFEVTLTKTNCHNSFPTNPNPNCTKVIVTIPFQLLVTVSWLEIITICRNFTKQIVTIYSNSNPNPNCFTIGNCDNLEIVTICRNFQKKLSQILQTYCHHRFTRLIVNTLKTKLWNFEVTLTKTNCHNSFPTSFHSFTIGNYDNLS